MIAIIPQPLCDRDFTPFGDVLTAGGTPDMVINQGLCDRFHDRAQLNFGPDGRAGISIFNAKQRHLPLTLDMVERHPDGSQAFIPMSRDPFLVIVAPDQGGRPGAPRAFISTPDQAINLHRGTWHGVLCPLGPCGIFAVIDRIGDTQNLQEHWYSEKYVIQSSD